ncbi:hypothetical protein GIB67_000106 [Kingdonia uniflora]|uniref:CCHC-type domain-containing protein n=1 Tax=Kingdonia uniflora TaxID=39325 RepID=A0A7J7M5X2_9MAGN|nr:hypothetical protein GIB67_000106 [Kingdonia uniflora]
MYVKETFSFEEVTSTLLSEERRLKGNESFVKNSTMGVSGKINFNRFRKGTCWSCGQSGHYRSDCKAGKGNGASSAKGSKSDTNKLTTVTSNDSDEALLVVAADGSRHDRGWVFDSGATMHLRNLAHNDDLIRKGVNYASGGAGILNDTGLYFVIIVV